MASGAMPNAAVERAKELVCAADGIVAITPVFAASYSGVGVFKMFVDALGTDALNGMPMIVAATAGTARHSLVLDHALRPPFAHLRRSWSPPASSPRPRTSAAGRPDAT